MTANSGNGKASAGATLNSVTGGRPLVIVLDPFEGVVEVYLDDEAVGTKPVQPLVETYGKDSVLCGKLRRGQSVEVKSPHLAAWLLNMSNTLRPPEVEEIVRINSMIARMA